MSLLNLTKLTWILFLLCICFLTLCDAGLVQKAVVHRRNVTLTCNTSDNTQRIIWRSLSLSNVDDELFETRVAVCKVNQTICATVNPAKYYATRQDTVSKLTFLVSSDGPLLYDCMLGTEVIQNFTLTLIDVGQIESPNCSVSPIFMTGPIDIETVNFTCESRALGSLVPHLSVSFGLPGISDISSSSLLLKTPLDVNTFKIVSNASCESSFGDLNEDKTCSFPVYVDVWHVLKGHDAEFVCELESSETSDITWSLIDEYIGDVDIDNRSWTRQGGRFMLLQDITDSDVGRIVECKTFSPETPFSLVAVGFDLIYRVSTMTPSTKHEEPNSTPPAATNKAPDEKIYLTLTIVFIIMEVITITLIVAFVVYTNNCIGSSRKSGNKPLRLTLSRDDSVRQGTQARGGADLPVIEGNENNSASSSISRTQGRHRSQPPSIDDPIYFSLEAPTTLTTSSTKPHSGSLDINEDYHEDECTGEHKIYEVCDGDGAAGGLRFDQDYGDDFGAGGSRLDDDSDRCRDPSGYDLVKIPSRNQTVDVEDVADINNGQSVEDISKLYGKVNKNCHS